MKTHAFRLKPGQKLKEEIDAYVLAHNIKAGVILTCVGSLSQAVLRMAGARIINTYEGPFEIVSLVGTLDAGYSHLHMTISDTNGQTYGGHLKQGSIVGSTAEVVIGELEGFEFSRSFDQATGYNELVIDKT